MKTTPRRVARRVAAERPFYPSAPWAVPSTWVVVSMVQENASRLPQPVKHKAKQKLQKAASPLAAAALPLKDSMLTKLLQVQVPKTLRVLRAQECITTSGRMGHGEREGGMAHVTKHVHHISDTTDSHEAVAAAQVPCCKGECGSTTDSCTCLQLTRDAPIV